ncbi:Uncharacterised protein [Chlamydia trachomatis]|nr:Uncharacterised protein [Chlamydia trachomatis]
MAFNIPLLVSATLGVGFPNFSFFVAAFIMIAPNLERSYSSLNSFPKPKQPDAGIMGFFNSNPGKFIFKRLLFFIF